GERAREGGRPAGRGRGRAEGPRKRRAGSRGRRPAMEDRPCAASVARVGARGHRAGPRRRRGGRRAGQGGGNEPRLRAGGGDSRHRRLPVRIGGPPGEALGGRPRARDQAWSSALRLAMADLRFAAWFLWMTPLLAALSRPRQASRMAAFAASTSPASAASRNLRTLVFSDDLTALLRCLA